MEYQVVWRGIVHDLQGYSKASREYILALDRAGVDIKVEPLNFGTPEAQIDEKQKQRIIELVNKPYADNKKKILVYHAQPYGVFPVEERKKFDYVVINTVWETTKIPKEWFPNINQADAVVIPSSQNLAALRDSGVTVPIILAPHGADTEMFSIDNEPLPLANVKDNFVFLSVFQWQHRKAPDVLLKAYWNEFTDQDNVALVMKTFWGNAATREQQRAIINNISAYKSAHGKKNSAPVYATTSTFSDNQMKSLYRIADVFVLPSRGEGVGLPYIESMCSGIPVISTRWGGQMDFLNSNNAFLVDYDLRPTDFNINDGVAPNFFHLFTHDMLWAEPSVESLMQQMRSAYTNRIELKVKARQARKDMEGMTWDNSGKIMKDFFNSMVG